ncbi:MAG: FAD-dependent oxidoreductase [Patescibacteria group bacterium]
MSKIVIVGGGFGGVRAALDLSRRLKGHATITLIDRSGYHLFYPSLYEIASAYRSDTDPYSLELRRAVTVPLNHIFSGTGVDVVQAEVSQIDLARQIVGSHAGGVWPYDYLIMGLGTEAADFGIRGVGEYAYLFKSVEHALMINQRLQTIFYEAEHGQRVMPLHIVVAGGGFTGVELAAEIASCASKLAKICGLASHCFYVSIVESGKVLKMLNDAEQAVMRRRLTKLGVALMENVQVSEVSDGMVKLRDGRHLKSDMTIWTAGARPHQLLSKIPGLELAPQGKIAVDEYLRIRHVTNVFAVGDTIEFIDPVTNQPEGAQAYIAIEHGATAADNILRSIWRHPLRKHRPPAMVWVAPGGGKFALAHLWKGVRISGFFGWILREIIDLRYFLTILPVKKAFQIFWHQTHEFTKND